MHQNNVSLCSEADPGLQDKLGKLKRMLSRKDKILIGFSGGVDSTLLAKVAADVLGERALSVILDSETLSRRELEQAEALARDLGVRFQVARYTALEDEAFTGNPADRCYLCKKASAKVLKEIAAREGIACIADGVNTSDYEDYRPGIRACQEEGIWHPFVDAGISKSDIRAISKQLGLKIWDKPSSACLASRIPYGQKITQESLVKVETSEDILKDLGLDQVRVRVHGDLARIEVPQGDIDRVLKSRERIVKGLKDAGFRYVTLDLKGYRTGSLNEALSL